jgi:hypothetical protein
MPQEPSHPTNLGPNARRALAEIQLQGARPWALPAVVTILIVSGLAAVDVTARALIAVPAPFFAFSKPLAIFLICLTMLVASFVLLWGLRRGSLWAWAGAVSWSIVGVALSARMLGVGFRGGLPLSLAVRLMPLRVGLMLLSTGSLLLLLRRDLRAWLATARRLRN